MIGDLYTALLYAFKAPWQLHAHQIMQSKGLVVSATYYDDNQQTIYDEAMMVSLNPGDKIASVRLSILSDKSGGYFEDLKAEHDLFVFPQVKPFVAEDFDYLDNWMKTSFSKEKPKTMESVTLSVDEVTAFLKAMVKEKILTQPQANAVARVILSPAKYKKFAAVGHKKPSASQGPQA